MAFELYPGSQAVSGAAEKRRVGKCKVEDVLAQLTQPDEDSGMITLTPQ